MPICQNCDEKWTWMETVKKSFTLDHWMNCPHCGEKQYVSKSARVKGSIFLFLPIVSMFTVIWLDISLQASLIIVLVFSIIIFSLYPLTLRLSNEEETFW